MKWPPSPGYAPVLGPRLLGLLVGFRILNALIVRTSFTPDEFWQGPEVAHLLAFGKGHLTWEWWPSARIRGFAHPLIFAGLFKALAFAGLDTRWAVAHSPKLFQGILAGVCDFYTFGLTLETFGAAAAGWALLFQTLSWFNFYCLVRPYSNSVEAVLATAALYYWVPIFLPRGGAGRDKRTSAGMWRWKGEKSRESVALLLAALCVVMRPTSAALWAAVGMLRLSTIPLRLWPRYVLLTVSPPLATVIGSSIYLDSRLYGAATLVPLNFLRFNVLEGKSRIFGEQAWHWNFSQGLPAVLGAALPWAMWGFFRGTGGGSAGSVRGGNRALGWLVVWFLVYHSTSPHKEFRFLLPVLPIAHAFAGAAVSNILLDPSIAHDKAAMRKKSDDDDDDRNDKNGSNNDNGDDGDDNAGLDSRTVTRSQSRAAAAAVPAVTQRPQSQSQSQSRSQSRSSPLLPPGNSRRAAPSCAAATAAAALFCLHMPAAIYLSVWHQSGALSAVDVVAERIPAIAETKIASCSRAASGGAGVKDTLAAGGESQAAVMLVGEVEGDAGGGVVGVPGVGQRGCGSGVVVVDFLMPCHSAPLNSHLHFRDVETVLWSLDCSPENRARPESSESDQFLSDPLAFLKATYGAQPGVAGGGELGPRDAPDVAVIYAFHLEKPGVVEYLAEELGLEAVRVVFNAHVNGDADSDEMYATVVVLQLASYSPTALRR